MNHHPRNSQSNFTNKLARTIDLPENMEVGLAEMSYIKSFNNIHIQKGSLQVFDFLYRHETGYWGEMFDCYIPEGYYSSDHVFADALNRSISQSVPRIREFHKKIFEFNDVTRKYSYDLRDPYLTIRIKGDLLRLLGAGKGNFTLDQALYIGAEKKDKYSYWNAKSGEEKLRRLKSTDTWKVSAPSGEMQYVSQMEEVDSFIVYCSIIEQQIVGDTYSEMLRWLPIQGVDGKRSVERFIKPHYVAVRHRHIPSIQISIKDIFDEFVKFQSGVVQVKLHFRRRKAL
tara:strand:- start:1965 stop:2819 length:855 start_codon:yes stop_codon:yes gene_type:complete